METPLPGAWENGFMVDHPMRVLQVNLNDGQGGAARVALNLQQAYRMRGLDARLAVSRKFGIDPFVCEIPHEKYKPAAARFLLSFGRKLETISLRAPGVGIGRLGGFLISLVRFPVRFDVFRGREVFYAPGTMHLLDLFDKPVDILHLHNLHKDWLTDRREFFDLRALPWLSRRVPVVMTLHDAWLSSGHCAHSFDCLRWQSGCGDCPYLDSYPAIQRDATGFNWKRKQAIFRECRLNVSTPSRWLMEKMERSILSTGMISSRVIPNGVDLTVFHPGPGDRDALGLPGDARIILLSADGIRTNKYKDFQTLSLAFTRVAERVPGVLFVALGEAGGTEQAGRAEIRFVPYQKDPELVARYYRAADLYVHASRADTFPNSVIEALACGKPVVASRVGGIPEQIQEGRTGFLTPAGDPAEMAKRMEQVLTDPVLKSRMGRAAAQDARTRFDLDRQAGETLDWYQEILQRTC
jgi:glycosyltransferase involved in cell wall biosynthesis